MRLFKLAFLEAGLEEPDERTARGTLKDFVIPDPELVPDCVGGGSSK